MNILDVTGKIENVLIIRRNNIGDMICALPVFRAIRNKLPDAHITVVAEKTNSIIIERAPFIDHLIVYNKGSGIFRNKYLNFWKLLRQNKVDFDLAIVLKAGIFFHFIFNGDDKRCAIPSGMSSAELASASALL